MRGALLSAIWLLSFCAARASEPWVLVLRQQLIAEQQCALDTINSVHWARLGEDRLPAGMIACIDGRAFEFSQLKRHLKFELEAWEPILC